jgi:hypothetical protein
MFDGWFRSEGMMAAAANMVKISQKLSAIPKKSVAQVAVFAEGESMYRARKSANLATVCLSDIRRTLAQCGAPYDLYSVSDLANPIMEKYSFYIFLNQYDLTDQTRARIDALCRRQGKTALWLYAPDYASNGENSADRISAVTGISVLETAADPGKLVWEDAPTYAAPAPHFVISDDSAKIIARFEDGSPAVAEKTEDGARSIYAALYRLPASLLRKLLIESGIFLYSGHPLVYTYANSAFLGAYNATEEDAILSVPEDGEYFDHIGNTAYTAENGCLRLPKRDIRAFLLTPRA